MSYMRGTHYLWRDDTRLHLWVHDGYDGWDEAGWTPGLDRQPAPDDLASPRPSGVGIHQAVVDEYVAMRFAELLRARLVDAAVGRALSKHAGNGGCADLQRYAETMHAVAGSA